MSVTLTDPQGLPKVEFFHQVSIASGSKIVFMAGQVAWDANGTLVGEGDLAAQVEQCYLNVGAALAEIGGSFDDIVKLTNYVTDWSVDKMPLVQEGARPSLRQTRCHHVHAAGHLDWRRRVVRPRAPRRGGGDRGARLARALPRRGHGNAFGP